MEHIAGRLIQENHTNSLRMFRGFLALAIIWHHLGAVPLMVNGNNIFFLISFPGRIVVWLFFVISGFSIYYGYQNNKYEFSLKDSLRFYFNRAIRILPLFYASVILTWISFLYVLPQELPSWLSIIRTLFIPEINFYHGIYVFTPSWFIGIILYFYLFAPLIVKMWGKMKNKFGIPILFIFLIGFTVICHKTGEIIGNTADIRNFIGCLPLFLFGFIAYDLYYGILYSKKEIQNLNRGWAFLFGFLIVLLLESAFLLYQIKYTTFMSYPMEGFIGVIGMATIIILLKMDRFETRQRNLIVKNVSLMLDRLGKQSYGLYLWHGMVIILFLRTGVLGLAGPPYKNIVFLLQAFFITSVITYLISTVFYNLVERPYHRLYRKRIVQPASDLAVLNLRSEDIK